MGGGQLRSWPLLGLNGPVPSKLQIGARWRAMRGEVGDRWLGIGLRSGAQDELGQGGSTMPQQNHAGRWPWWQRGEEGVRARVTSELAA
jgi:hypothetical protein